MGFDYNSLLAFIIFGVTIGVVYGIVALGISLIYSGLDIVHFAHGEMYMFGLFRACPRAQCRRSLPDCADWRDGAHRIAWNGCREGIFTGA